MILFQNPGALDLRAISMVGLTSKTGEDTIGRFGTGFKYALAVVTRGGGSFPWLRRSAGRKLASRTGAQSVCR